MFVCLHLRTHTFARRTTVRMRDMPWKVETPSCLTPQCIGFWLCWGLRVWIGDPGTRSAYMASGKLNGLLFKVFKRHLCDLINKISPFWSRCILLFYFVFNVRNLLNDITPFNSSICLHWLSFHAINLKTKSCSIPQHSSLCHSKPQNAENCAKCYAKMHKLPERWVLEPSSTEK